MQHLDEGTIHAWLDEQLPRDEAAAVEAHVAECRQCADAVAEARGLIAASSRILTALDNVPRDVAPNRTPALPTAATAGVAAPTPAPPSPGSTSAAQRARRRWLSGPSLAAAATIFVAVGTLTIMRAGKDMAPESRAPNRQEATASAPQPMLAVDSQASGASAAMLPPAVPSAAGAGAAPGVANEASAADMASRRRALADAARPERDEAGAARLRAPAESSPRAPASATIARVGVDSASRATANTALGEARREVAGAPPLQQTAEQEQQRAASGQRVDLAKARERAVASAPPPAPPRPETATVQVFRGAKAADARFADSVRAEPAAKVSADVSGAAAAGTVRGRVTDANNTGLANVMVQVVGTSIGVTTSERGDFVLRGVPTGAQRVTARRIGFSPATLEITVGAGQVASADFKLAPAAAALENVVVTGSAAAPRRPMGAAAVAAPPAPSAQLTRGQPQNATAYGCYDLGITPGTSQTRSGFRPVPRRIALDSTLVPGRTDGVWYVARDLSGSAAAGNGVWRPTGPDGIEAQWAYGTRTATIRLTGVPGQVLRGLIEEIDRAAAIGAAGTVVAGKVRCPAG